jgi:hypothetical protein
MDVALHCENRIPNVSISEKSKPVWFSLQSCKGGETVNGKTTHLNEEHLVRHLPGGEERVLHHLGRQEDILKDEAAT